MGPIDRSEKDYHEIYKQHMDRVHAVYRSRPHYDITKPRLDKLVSDQYLQWAVSVVESALKAREGKEPHSCERMNFPGAYVAVSVLQTLDYSMASKYIGGYLPFLDKLMRESGYMQGGIELVHWTYCFEGEKSALHLTILFNTKLPDAQLLSTIAQDLLTPGEKTMIGLS